MNNWNATQQADVEALYLLPLIGDAARLEMRIEALKNAMNEDK